MAPLAIASIGYGQAMKSPSGWKAARCDEHPFRPKIKVSILAVGVHKPCPLLREESVQAARVVHFPSVVWFPDQ